jgi:putative ABC transport system permease protein
LGPLRENPGRPLLALAAIALGVALGVAVHLINSSALSEFGLAARHLAGEAAALQEQINKALATFDAAARFGD